MTWSIGSFTFPAGEEPNIRTRLQFAGGEQVWSTFDPIGSNKTILTYLSQRSQIHEWHAFVSEASKDTLKDIYDARSTVAAVHPWGTADSVLMQRFTARVYHVYPERWEVNITLLER